MAEESGKESSEQGSHLSEEAPKRVRCAYCNKLNTVFNEAENNGKNGKTKADKPKGPVCRRCRLPLERTVHKKWSFVHPDAYIHPLDRQALQALRAIPGVDMVLKKLMGLTSERMLRVFCKANSVKVSKDQYPRLDAMLEVACETLNLPKPELYVSVTSGFGGLTINAFTSGVDEPFIVLYSGLVERLSDEELLAVIAHELGHIHCQHLLYRTAAIILLNLLNMTPLGGMLSGISMPIQMGLIMWMQKSELSCDRAALLVTQDERAVMSALTKMAGGNLNDELNLDAFIKQAREFDQAFEENFLDKIWTLILAARSTHPFPVWRISEILKWTEDKSSYGYHQIVAHDDRIDFPLPKAEG